ncbi:MAG: dihydrolipoyl dehydrogenase [Desulfobacterota bacterium]|nr:dihydrolipoyl dehydrogenase [Thermodesulfobacteriota bacterium]
MDSKRIIVIGGGPGGYVAALRAAQLGAKVSLIEREKIGGTCLHRGCIPTKTLLHEAKLLGAIKRSPVFRKACSIDPSEVFGAMRERKARVIEELTKGVEGLLESHRVLVRRGRADLLSSDRVALFPREGGEERLEADAIILAPGSKAKELPHIPHDGVKVLHSDEALELTDLPRQMVILGGGYIGVEFATLFNLLGTKVTVVEILDTILPGLEGELVRHLSRFMERDGIRILTRSSVEEVTSDGEGLRLLLRTPQGLEEAVTEKLLVAVGRVARLEQDFSKVGIEVSPKGIKVGSSMETTLPRVYAVGDATGGVMLAHVAMEQGILAAEHALGLPREWESPPIPLCIFSLPEVASIGLTEAEAKKRGEVKIGRFPFRSNPKAVLSGETDGLIKVVADREGGEILGIHIVGPEATLLVSWASAMLGRKLREAAQFIQAHPTLPEALREACLDAEGLALHLPRPLHPKR